MRTLALVIGLLGATNAWADEPRDLLAQAKAFERAGQWQEARDAYGKLEAVDGWRGVGFYGEGWSAFQQGDFAAAANLAAKAIAAPHSRRDEARALYGDALFKLHEYERARNVYVVTERSAPAAMKVMLQKKIAACDRMLQKSS